MNRTKTVITYALLNLLEEKPYNKVTVKDITEHCQINRNTFYYHFKDIPDVLEKIVIEATDYFIQKYSHAGSTSIDCLSPIVKYCLKRKKMLLNIYNSVRRDIFLTKLDQTVLYAVSQYIDIVTAELSISSADKKLLTHFYKCVLVGVILDWLDNGMDYELLERLVRTKELFVNSNSYIIL